MKGISTLAALLLVASFFAPATLRAGQLQPHAKGAPQLKESPLSSTTSFAVVNADGTLDHGSIDELSSSRISEGIYSVVFNIQDRFKCAYAATTLNQTTFNPVTMTVTFDLNSTPGEIEVLSADNSKQPIDTAFSLIVVCPQI